MLLIIFGAGASTDSDARWPMNARQRFRPPLANELFADYPELAEAIQRYADVAPIVPFLRNLGELSLEGRFERFIAQSKDYPERVIQLMAARYNLRLVLWRCGENYLAQASGVTNYAHMLGEVDRWRTMNNQKVLIVTFN